MMIKQFVVDGYESNCYVVSCTETGQALVVDPGKFLEAAADHIGSAGLTVHALVITHGHYDHVGGVEAMVERYGCEVLSGTGEAVGSFGKRVDDGETLELGKFEGKFLLTPGHTEDSICFQLEDAVFTGDALFAGAIGGTSSAEDMNRLKSVLREKILSLPDDTRLYPGHGAASTVRIERTANPFFTLP